MLFENIVCTPFGEGRFERKVALRKCQPPPAGHCGTEPTRNVNRHPGGNRSVGNTATHPGRNRKKNTGDEESEQDPKENLFGKRKSEQLGHELSLLRHVQRKGKLD